MPTATMEEVQAHLPEILDRLNAEEELIILRDGVAVAKLAPTPVARVVRVAGRGKGKIVVVSDDDEHLRDFEEYMP